MGGLGNQLFQYACGRYLALQNKTTLKLDATGLSRDDRGIIRPYSLGVFNIQAGLATAEEIKQIKREPRGRWPKKIKHALKKHSIIPAKNYIPEIDFSWEKILSLRGNLYLGGFFQNEKFFDQIAETIRQDFTLKPELADFDPALTEKIKKSLSVSLHIRRGDYASDEATRLLHGLQPLEYYRQAMELISQKIDNPKYFVFSDDIAWCQKNLPMPPETIFVTGKKDYEDLTLMKQCRHHIIANSTFSWWGAWLNDNPDKIVIAPARWFADEKLNEQTKNLVPGNWIRI